MTDRDRKCLGVAASCVLALVALLCWRKGKR